MTDLTYHDNGLFTAFIPQTSSGENAWYQLAKATEGTGKVLSIHAKQTIQQLRAAGYGVTKAKPVKLSDDDLAELGV